MISFFTILLPILFGILSIKLSSSKFNKQLMLDSTTLKEPILKALLKKFTSVLDIPPIKIMIYEIKGINGLATSNGSIFITRGCLDAFYTGKITAEEISTIVAHELGHVALGHSKRRIIDFSSQSALRIILSLTIGRFVPALGAFVANAITSLLAAKLSRKDEFEADAYAAALLIKSGLGIEPQISLLRKLNSLSELNQQTPAWLMSHPKPALRINAIKELKDKWSDLN